MAKFLEIGHEMANLATLFEHTNAKFRIAVTSVRWCTQQKRENHS